MKYLLILLGMALTSQAISQPVFVPRVVATGLHAPWEVVWGPDNFLWVTELDGTVSRLDPFTGSKDILLRLGDVLMDDEAGLAGLAIHPQFPDSNWVFLAYNYADGIATELRVVKYTYQPDTLLNPIVLIEDIAGASTNNGGRLVATADRRLLLSVGDAGNTSLPQSNASSSGKVLRMTFSGHAPADNPIAGSLIWSKGFRDPQGLHLASNGVLYLSDQGNTADDEINVVAPGGNYGWPNVEGACNLPGEMTFCADSSVIEPVFSWASPIEVAGLEYYDHVHYPDLENSLLSTALDGDHLVALELNGAGSTITGSTTYLMNDHGRLRDLCVSPLGLIFIATSNRDGHANGGFPIADDDQIIELSTGFVGISEVEPLNAVAYPNPFSQNLRVDLDRAVDRATVSLLDLSGRLISTWNLQGRSIQLQAPHVPSGAYLLVIEAEGLKDTLRLVKR